MSSCWLAKTGWRRRGGRCASLLKLQILELQVRAGQGAAGPLHCPLPCWHDLSCLRPRLTVQEAVVEARPAHHLRRRRLWQGQVQQGHLHREGDQSTAGRSVAPCKLLAGCHKHTSTSSALTEVGCAICVKVDWRCLALELCVRCSCKTHTGCLHKPRFSREFGCPGPAGGAAKITSGDRNAQPGSALHSYFSIYLPSAQWTLNRRGMSTTCTTSRASLPTSRPQLAIRRAKTQLQTGWLAAGRQGATRRCSLLLVAALHPGGEQPSTGGDKAERPAEAAPLAEQQQQQSGAPAEQEEERDLFVPILVRRAYVALGLARPCVSESRRSSLTVRVRRSSELLALSVCRSWCR